MKKIILFLLVFLPLLTQAQTALTPKAEKELEAAIDLYNKGNRSKGIENVRKVLDANSDIRSLWDLLAQMQQRNYELAQRDFNTAMSKSMEEVLKNMGKSEKEGSKKKNKSTKGVMEAMGPYISAQMAYEAYLREATLKSRSTVASMFLRSEKIDAPKPDSLVGSKAREAFRKAESRFVAEDYQGAIPYYREAITESEGPYFSAELYLGDAYYMLAEYDSAEKYFTLCAQSFPQYIEPHKYLGDCYGKQFEFEKAIQACSEAIFVYPDASMFMKLEDCADFLRKKYNDGWIVRGCYPYSAKSKGSTPVVPEGVWTDYQELSTKIWAESDSLGVITHPEKFDGETYAEVYVWKKLLEKNSQSEELAFARDMQQKGYLDCYVFVSLFHFDLYPTYRHFIANNKEKATAYLRDVVIYKP